VARKKKEEIITFKVDEGLAHAMDGIPNRSEFIRSAIMAALDSTCPLCRGTGIMTPDQLMHWKETAKSHAVRECAECHALTIVCSSRGQRHVH
jgi:hypothetical protein